VEQMADTLDDLAAKYSVSVEAVEVLMEALGGVAMCVEIA
jgi:hypothetical protein